MSDRVARPRQVKQSEKLDVLKRTKREFAVTPYALNSNRWSGRLRSATLKNVEEENEEAKGKRLIRDASRSIKGIEFPAEELAKIIRGWMAQDEA
jgi:hypothetical protein